MSIVMLGFGLIAPILPQYACNFDMGVFAADFVASSSSIFQLVSAPVSGSLVERLGYRYTYLIGISIVAFSILLVDVAQTYWQPLVFRALGGVGSTMLTVLAMGLIMRISPPEIRGRDPAAYDTVFLSGNVSDPIISAAVDVWGVRIPFFIYGDTLVAATIVVGMPLGVEHFRHVVSKRTAPVLKFSEAIRDSAYRSALVGAFVGGWSNFGARVTIVPLLAAATFSHVGAPEPGSNGAAAATAIAGFAPTAFAFDNVMVLQFSDRLSDRIGHRPLLITGLFISDVFTGATGFSSGAVLLLILPVLAGFGADTIGPSRQAVLANVIDANRQGGRILVNFQTVQDSGAISGPLIVGTTVDAVGFKAGLLACGIISSVAMVGWIFGRETLSVQSSSNGAEEAKAKIA